nr:innexin inx1 isoform X2 [Aedes albopictus]
MYKLLGGLKDYFKRQDIYTDSAVFRLHNSFTTALLLACSLIITATQYVGQPISCIVNGIPTHVVNTFCWISSTFTMPDAYKREAVACYVPKFLWDATEGGLMRSIVMGLNIGICREDEKCAKKQALIEYVLKRLRRHKLYVLRYFACEALCFVNIIVQLWMMNRFFDGEFYAYGWKVLKFSEVPQDQRLDPMVYVFPRVTKCIFYKYGASGTIQKHDSLCILPLNIVNEKTYIFIWFWFIILATMLLGLLIYRAMIIFMPSFRIRLLNTINRLVPREAAEAIGQKTDLGDWWVIYMLGGNLDPPIFKDVVAELAKQIEPPHKNGKQRL